MKGFDDKYKDFPDYILKITKQIWEGKDVESIVIFILKIFQSGLHLVLLMVTNQLLMQLIKL